MIWPRILTDQEISNIARNCECPLDYAVAMTLDKSEMVEKRRTLFVTSVLRCNELHCANLNALCML